MSSLQDTQLDLDMSAEHNAIRDEVRPAAEAA